STCTGTDQITIEYFEEFTPNSGDNLFFCSASGFGVFDLTSNIPTITSGLPANYIVTFHNSQTDAEDGIGAIANADAFENTTNPQTVFVRVKPPFADCYETTSFSLIVEDLT
ncbi:hypothetical protein V6O07_16475, partial [Arthrospira platensis SPKY2]